VRAQQPDGREERAPEKGLILDQTLTQTPGREPATPAKAKTPDKVIELSR
jgi:hypothetical protein